MKLTILRGLPGAGKSTWAAAQPEPSICPDDFKKIIRDRDYANEMRDYGLRLLLMAGWDVIADGCHLEDSEVDHLRAIAEEFGAEVEVVTFHQPLSVLVERVRARKGLFGKTDPDRCESELRKLHRKYA